MLGVSTRKVQEMAAAGRLPGAAKIDQLWTFDPAKDPSVDSGAGGTGEPAA